MVMLSGLGIGASAAHAGPPAGFAITTIASGLNQPVAHAYSPDGRLFIAEKSGRVLVQSAVPGSPRTVFIDLRARINDYGERGLTGLALDPNFAVTGKVFLLYTREPNLQTLDSPDPATAEIAWVSTSVGDLNAANPASLTALAEGNVTDNCCHSIGALRFDAPGRLLASFGDGNSLNQRAQSIDWANGKIFRIDPVTGAGVSGNPYFDPAAPSSVRSRVLARGLRNPFRFFPDPVTGDVWVGDVGQETWEELDRIPAIITDPVVGANYGWPCYEGGAGISQIYPGALADPAVLDVCQSGTFNPAEGGTGTGATPAVAAYGHANPDIGAAIVGGPVYRGLSYPAGYVGAVFVGDAARDAFSYYLPGTGFVDFGVDGGWGYPVDIIPAPNGDLSYAALFAGEIRQIVWLGGNSIPVVSASGTPTAGAAPLSVQFSSAVTDADLSDVITTSWTFGDGSPAVATAAPAHIYATPGSYTATFVANDGRPGGRVEKTVAINVGNTAPVVNLSSPQTTFGVGDTITFNVSAVDPEDGALSGTAIATRIQRIHLAHVHPISDKTGVTGSVVASDHGDDPGSIEIITTATDRFGLTATKTLSLQPRRVPIVVSSNRPGSSVILDGRPLIAPQTVQSVVGGSHILLAAATAGDATFRSWAVNGVEFSDPSLTFQTPSTGASLEVVYTPPPVPAEVVAPLPGALSPAAPVVGGAPAVRTAVRPPVLSGRLTVRGRAVQVSLVARRRGRLTVDIAGLGQPQFQCRTLVSRPGQRYSCRVRVSRIGVRPTARVVLRDLKGRTYSLRLRPGRLVATRP
jgi:glucose/arabinose dehydrogenase